MRNPQTLSEKLKSYSLVATSMLASAAAADAQVIYTDVNPDITGGYYQLDLNNDGTFDYSLWASSAISAMGGYFHNSIWNDASNSFATDPDFMPIACDYGLVIGASLNWNSYDYGTLAKRYVNYLSGTTELVGNWVNASIKYLPLRFIFNGEQHYGWVRLHVAAGPDSASNIIYDYAYEALPFTPIIAGCINGVTAYADADSDGYGNSAISLFIADCIPLNGYVVDSTDCDDTNPFINPGACDGVNGIDDNCDGYTDNFVNTTTYYQDGDNDGFGGDITTFQACSPPPGYVANNTDCNDSIATINPLAIEICNTVDDNCNGLVDEGLLITFYGDVDGDGYGFAGNAVLACSAPTGFVSDSTDCDDGNPTVYPGAPEILNGIDDNCNGQIDESVGINEPSTNFFSIFPNPNNGIITIQGNLHNEESLIIKVFDLAGKELHAENFGNVSGTFSKQLDLSNFSEGTYLVQVIHNGEKEVKKLVIQK